MKFLKFSLVLVVATLVLSCSKDDKDKTAPVITISTPSEGDTVIKGVPFQLIAVVTDDTELAQITLNDATVITEFDTPTKHSLNYNVTIPEDAVGTVATMKITALDKAGNAASETVNVNLQ